jgi:hypothetical protein
MNRFVLRKSKSRAINNCVGSNRTRHSSWWHRKLDFRFSFRAGYRRCRAMTESMANGLPGFLVPSQLFTAVQVEGCGSKKLPAIAFQTNTISKIGHKS